MDELPNLFNLKLKQIAEQAGTGVDVSEALAGILAMEREAKARTLAETETNVHPLHHRRRHLTIA